MTTALPATRDGLGLDRLQLGHIRRIEALSLQAENDWSGMQNRMGQYDFGGYRFQIAYSLYALGIAHRHRLPNAPGVFKPVFERLIAKMRLPDVWMYWRDVSQGGAVFNAHLDLQERWDPVAVDNIMYSAYLNSTALMYNVLFGDDRYAQEGALSLDHWSFFWGGQEKHFSYDQNSLTDQIYWQLVKNGYIGVACEPNCIFQICNQPSILAFRLQDQLLGTDRADEVIAGYQAAWDKYGTLDGKGHYFPQVFQDSGAVRVNDEESATWDAWLGALMNTWNHDFVHQHYPAQIRKQLIHGPDGTIDARRAPRITMGSHVVENDTCEFGWSAVWASEMGDQTTLDGLVRHAERYMDPTWVDGALFYPRNDEETDAEGHRVLVEPLVGNTLLGYARLNVPDGLWTLFNEPWDPDHFREPLVDGLTDAVDLTQARFDRAGKRLELRAARRAGRSGDATILVSNVPAGSAVHIDGVEESGVRDGDLLRITVPAGGEHEIVIDVPTWDIR